MMKIRRTSKQGLAAYHELLKDEKKFGIPSLVNRIKRDKMLATNAAKRREASRQQSLRDRGLAE